MGPDPTPQPPNPTNPTNRTNKMMVPQATNKMMLRRMCDSKVGLVLDLKQREHCKRYLSMGTLSNRILSELLQQV